MTSPLYRFIGDHMILKGTIKLAVTVVDHPRMSMVVAKFLAVDYPLTFNEVIGRLLLKALKVVVFDLLPDNEVPHRNGNQTSPREVIRFERML